MQRHLRVSAGFVVAAVLALCLAGCGTAPTRTRVDRVGTDGSPKYVFLFIGDGMGLVHAHAAEIYRAALRNSQHIEVLRNSDGTSRKRFAPGSDTLLMNRFPVAGITTTYSADEQITDSAAAGTALATGRKTSNGTISMDPTARHSYVTLAELAKARGLKVGIVSSTSIDDATPAVFYAHQSGRSERQAIDAQLVASNFDYFAGAEMAEPAPGQEKPAELARRRGFKVATTRDELAACRRGDQVLFEARLPYEVDRLPERVSLTELTQKGIELLAGPQGFFLMVESGKPDAGGHSHDARVTIDEVLLLDAAVAKAVAFYEKHPTETLIVITSDHETGGMALGCGGAKSHLGLASLAAQKQSWQAFDFEVFAPYLKSHAWTSPSDNLPDELKTALQERMGLAYADLSEPQKARLEEAYDASMSQKDARKTKKQHPLYGPYEPFSVTVSEVISQRAGIGWTTFSHTAVPVPVRALGAGAYRFDGQYDNTAVARRLAEALRVGPLGD